MLRIISILVFLSLTAFPLNAFAAGAALVSPLTHFILAAINFTLYFFLLRFLYNKHGKPALKARSLKVKEHLARSKSAIGSAQEKYDGFKEKLDGIDLEKEDLLKRYDQEGRTQSSSLVSDAREASTRVGGDTERQIETELQRASKKIREEVVGKASLKAREKLSSLSESEDKALRKKVLEEFLNQDEKLLKSDALH